MVDSTRRFTDRVDDYVRYRPGYPAELVQTLITESGSGSGTRVADIGSGTGIFTRLLLEADLNVYAVEPNDEMRSAGDRLLSDFPGYTSIGAAAETTGLDDNSLELITAAQAFHWFNNILTRTEFRRILKPDGYLALIWNRRRVDQLFQQDYEQLLRRRAPEYNAVNHMNLGDNEIGSFFGPGSMKKFRFEYCQQFDFDGLLGRVRSSSYCPREASDEFRLLRKNLQRLFDEYQYDGTIEFEYDTNLYLGRL